MVTETINANYALQQSDDTMRDDTIRSSPSEHRIPQKTPGTRISLPDSRQKMNLTDLLTIRWKSKVLIFLFSFVDTHSKADRGPHFTDRFPCWPCERSAKNSKRFSKCPN